jgi:hypothetical protein
MKKFLIIGSLVLALVLSAGFSGAVYAQEQNPYPDEPGNRYGAGDMANMMSRMMRGMGACTNAEPGIMHDYMISAWAGVLGLEASDLEARLESERMLDIVTSQGYSFQEMRELRLEAKSKAFEQAVEEGLIDPQQYELMRQRMERSSERGPGMGNGMGHRGGGMHGQGMRGAQPQK